MEKSQQFASDNYSGVCPEAIRALERVNRGYVPSYGDDTYTRECCDALRDVFETDCEVFFVFNGTAANSLALAHLCAPYQSVIACDTAHIETDECGGPEFFANGSKLLTVPGRDGKLPPGEIGRLVNRRTDIHYPRPRVASITQATEIGTVYRVEELAAVGAAVRQWGLYLHMDGARFANAVASTGATPAELSWKCGVDVLSLGGTKNGLQFGEAVIFFNRKLAEDFDCRCKQGGQLASKMRFISGPWHAILRDGVWLNNARHANQAARELAARLREIPECRILFPVEANSVFVELPEAVQAGLRRRGWLFYNFIGSGGARLMCSWDTLDATIEEFVADLKAELAQGR